MDSLLKKLVCVEELISSTAFWEGPPSATYRRFKVFQQANGLSFADALGVFAKRALEGGGLKMSSMVTYVSIILEREKADRGFSASELSLTKALQAKLNLCATREDVKHATTATMTQMIYAFKNTKSIKLKACIWLMIVTGGRVADLSRLEAKNLSIGAKDLTVMWCISKNIRSQHERRTVSYQITVEPTLEVITYLTKLEGTLNVDCSAINGLLKALRLALTSYSFRRAVIASYPTWADAQEATGHQQKKTLRAHYDATLEKRKKERKGT